MLYKKGFNPTHLEPRMRLVNNQVKVLIPESLMEELFSSFHQNTHYGRDATL